MLQDGFKKKKAKNKNHFSKRKKTSAHIPSSYYFTDFFEIKASHLKIG